MPRLNSSCHVSDVNGALGDMVPAADCSGIILVGLLDITQVVSGIILAILAVAIADKMWVSKLRFGKRRLKVLSTVAS
jgi:hypothetical protein